MQVVVEWLLLILNSVDDLVLPISLTVADVAYIVAVTPYYLP